ncbi:uncharacterized protein ACA1_043590 [Acanthamoeba castellanii str. Neff]|uniref:Uncharacterized protein n=1 Tax=Acanthamoeba castellanii (strain ATCC 30010 / Neff) TaxID=1257118 RepID=L8GWF9_ACACF|nr:uncharacterized protein ACA1_043590 [Acanthamoeba castellanii str. Neff]ELR16928.1 hypothetical protein ACA1_043590 [Acanthamoeba castellanii str. Neff]
MDAPLHFKVETYEDRGNHPWVRKNYELDVPRTATVREALALFRANGAPSWMSDQKLAQELGLHIPRSLSSRPSLSPGVDDSPPIADDVLDSKVVDCGLCERKFTFSSNRPRGFGVYD